MATGNNWRVQAPAAGCCLAMAIWLAGCGGGGGGPAASAGPQATVSGSVTFEGKPVTLDANVVFYCPEQDVTASGKVDSLGKYSLTGSIPAKGIPAGRYEVMISPPAAPPPVVGTEEYTKAMMSKPTAPPPPKDIPAKFHSFATSKLVLEVKAGDNTFDFDLSKL